MNAKREYHFFKVILKAKHFILIEEFTDDHTMMARKKTTVDGRGPEKAKMEEKAVSIIFSSSERYGEK